MSCPSLHGSSERLLELSVKTDLQRDVHCTLKKSVPVLSGLPSEQGSNLPSGGNADGLFFLGKITSALVWHKLGNEGENHVLETHCSDAEEFPVLVTRSLFKNFCISWYLWNSFPGLRKHSAKVL